MNCIRPNNLLLEKDFVKHAIVVIVSIVDCEHALSFQAETALSKQVTLKSTVKVFRDQLDRGTSIVENHKSR